MNVGTAVKWTTSEDVVTGILLELTAKRVTIATDNGMMSFPVGDGTVEYHDRSMFKPKLMSEPNPAHDPNSLTFTKLLPNEVPKGVSKLTLAMALYDANKSRKENIEMFIRDIQLTAGGASTYYSQIKKRKGN